MPKKSELQNTEIAKIKEKSRLERLKILLAVSMTLLLGGSSIKRETNKAQWQNFQQEVIHQLLEINTEKPDKTAILELAKMAGTHVNLEVEAVLDSQKLKPNSPNFQNLTFSDLGGQERQIGFWVIPEMPDLEIFNPNKENLLTFSQNVGGEMAKDTEKSVSGQNYQNWKETLEPLLAKIAETKPDVVHLQAFAIQKTNEKYDQSLIQKFTNLGYNVFFTAMSVGESGDIDFGNVSLIRGKIDQKEIGQFKMELRVSCEGLTVSKELNSQTLQEMKKENSGLIYANLELKFKTENEEMIFGNIYKSAFLSSLERKRNFWQIADGLNPESRIMLVGDWNNYGNVDGRGLVGTVSAARSLLQDYGGTKEEAKQYQVILDEKNRKKWEKLQTQKENDFETVNRPKNSFPEKDYIYRQNQLPYRLPYFNGLVSQMKKTFLEFLSLQVDGVLTNYKLVENTDSFEPVLMKINEEYLNGFDHPLTTIYSNLNQDEFDKIKKTETDKLAIYTLICYLMQQNLKIKQPF